LIRFITEYKDRYRKIRIRNVISPSIIQSILGPQLEEFDIEYKREAFFNGDFCLNLGSCYKLKKLKLSTYHAIEILSRHRDPVTP